MFGEMRPGGYYLCLPGQEERSLLERLLRYDLRKFGKLVSLVLKAWPLDTSEGYLEGEEAVLEHLLTWSIAKNVFQLQGAFELWVEPETRPRGC
ncbi:hypothetical protein ANANG_G00027020 [Anguilla anguilla]|uniref:Uncharacterized protein n=1 Tax=Anguilla anguilla TaxID=7936 RepID=A0A9D3MTB2_ANGAN|nr:hypothetical protein ANANG_G00027020 [Anguilla anguilla]